MEDGTCKPYHKDFWSGEGDYGGASRSLRQTAQRKKYLPGISEITKEKIYKGECKRRKGTFRPGGTQREGAKF